MKIKKLLIALLLLFAGFVMVSCGETSSTDDNTPDEKQDEKQDDKKEDEGKGETEKKEASSIDFSAASSTEEVKTTAKNEYNSLFTETCKNLSEEQKAILEVKYQEVLSLLDEADGSIEELKKELNTYYQELNETIDLITKAISTFEEQKNLALEELKVMYEAISSVCNETTLEYVKNLYDGYVAEIKALPETAKDELSKKVKEFSSLAKEYVSSIADVALEEAIKIAREELKKQYELGVEKIESASLKEKVKALYEKIDLELAGIIDKEKSTELIENLLINFASELTKLAAQEVLEKAITVAREELKKVYENALAKIEKESIKEKIATIYTKADEKIAGITDSEKVNELIEQYSLEFCTELVNLLKEEAILGVAEYKDIIIAKVDAIYNNYASKIEDEKVKETLTTFYNELVKKINDCKTVEDVQKIDDEAKTDFEEYAKTVLVKKAIEAYKANVEGILKEYLEKIPDEDLKKTATDLYDKESAKLDKVENLDDLKIVYNEIKTSLPTELEKIVKEYAVKLLTASKDELKQSIDKLYNEAIQKAKDEEIAKELNTAKDNIYAEIDKIESVETLEASKTKIIEEFQTTIKSILSKLVKGYITQYKAELEKLVNEKLETITDEELKTSLKDLFNTTAAKLDEIKDFDELEEKYPEIKKEFIAGLEKIITEYAVKNLAQFKVTTKAEIDRVCTAAIAKVSDEEIKKELTTAKDNALQAIDAIESKDTAVDAITKIKEDFNTTVQNIIERVVLKTIASYKDEFAKMTTDAIGQIKDEELSKQLNDLVDKEIAKFDNVKDLDELKLVYASAKLELQTELKKIMADYATKKLAEIKENAKKGIDETLTTTIRKVTDEDIKKELTDAKDNALSELDKVNDYETAEAAASKIQDDLKVTINNILAKLVKKYVTAAQAEADTLKELVFSKLTVDSQTEFATIYNNYIETLSKINNYETASEEAKKATEKFMADTKTYVSKALDNYKTEALTTLKTKYDTVLGTVTVEIETYKTQFDTLYKNATDAINQLSDIVTFVKDSTAITEELVKNATTLLKEYLEAYAALVKEATLKLGADLYAAVYNKEEYTSLGIVAKGKAKVTIEAAYKAFTTTLNNLTPDVGAKKVCDEAYETLVKAFNSALGITTEN